VQFERVRRAGADQGLAASDTKVLIDTIVQ